MKLFHTTIFALAFWAVLAPMCSSKFGEMPGDSVRPLASPKSTPVTPTPPPRMRAVVASGIDHSQEPGLPID
jgi:hypothetical protein